MSDSDYFEIDFLAVETAKSGDAITLHYTLDDRSYTHVVDGGFTETGEKILNHINKYYGDDDFIDHVVLTHSDGDHARGLKHVLENGNIGCLWMNRPWLYVDELIDRFKTYNSADALKARLRKCYPTVVELEEIAFRKGIQINEAFQGASIGAFRVMSPPKEMYLDLIVASEKTPEGIDESEKSHEQTLTEMLKAAMAAVRGVIASLWGEEKFSSEDTSAENEMSVVQYANLCGKKLLLTGDAGRQALQQVINYAPWVGLSLPGIDRFQVPHHGSRRNVSTEVLDAILGERYSNQDNAPENDFTAIISSALADKDHPRKSVERAMRHRGGFVAATEGQDVRTSHNAPNRDGWTALAPRPYPNEQED
ncbi:MBL fold metallo-hydrolase [Parerythrobacter lacustris]|uniref:Competence protein ComEC n=1 Tax=Parerythrobacter lacustris TaxID=2969984 RepID=A0ABT1XSC2_9SPHN|nr:MBL fold metallo-hydrolase [Parerythrobacter lacustris]MCR2834507.1 competence protein ComEC [Parerythrobacter lacustris]